MQTPPLISSSDLSIWADDRELATAKGYYHLINILICVFVTLSFICTLSTLSILYTMHVYIIFRCFMKFGTCLENNQKMIQKTTGNELCSLSPSRTI